MGELFAWLGAAARFVWTDLLTVSFAFATVRTSTPLLFAATGGAICERGGIVNIALEGLLLAGAWAAVAGAAHWESAALGAAAAVAAGLVLAGVHALVTIRWKVDQIVSGVAINLFATGFTKLALDLQFHQSSNSGAVAAARLPTFLVGWGGFDLLVPLALATPFAAHLLLERTTFGLRLRATGEHPEAAESLGIHVGRVRALGVLASGALAAVGGVWLSYGQHQFVADMTSGRGFMALAAVIFGGWRPLRVLAACLLFGGLDALTFRLAARPGLGGLRVLVEVLPYVATLVVLATAVRRARAPAALGKP